MNVPLLSKEEGSPSTDDSSQPEDQETKSKKKNPTPLGSQMDDLPLPSRHIDRFATLVADDRIKEAEKILLKAAGVAVLLWVFLSLFFLFICPEESFELLEGPEQTAYSMVFSILLVMNVSRLMALVFKDDGRPLSLKSGFVLASYSAQFISTVTGFLIAFFPTPVLLDPITGQRVHMLRWAAWAPLSGLMTFMTEGIDMTLRKDGLKEACIHSFILFIGTLPGAMFPYVKNSTTWFFLFFFGVLCLFDVYYRYFSRRHNFLTLKKGASAEQILVYHQTRLGYRLLRTCFVMWSFVGVQLVAQALAPLVLPEGNIFRSPHFPAIVECSVEIVSKIWYLMVITSAYELIFDEVARTTRRLEELRSMMLTVWNKSSDIVVISTRARDDSARAVSMVNPAFLRVQSQKPNIVGESSALVLETPLFDNPDMRKSVLRTRTEGNESVADLFAIDLNEPISANSSTDTAWQTSKPELSPRCIQSLVDVLITAWQVPGREGLITCDFVYEGSDSTEKIAKCEAKVTRLESNTVMVVICDITERVRRFEAEKTAVAEMTARKKDSEANRFTKHEVKNGLLAAIGLCETIGGPKTKSKSSEVKKSDLGSKSLIAELDITLNEVLDTVLAEALTRDVVHEVYEPVLECINLPEILNDRARSHDGRFPLKVCPTPFPPFLLDPKIVKCIHRNAVSNSCKYGERGGVVATELTYNEVKKELEIKVVDRPGENHKNLVKLGPEEVNEVFSPGKSLHPGLPKDEDDHLERRFVTRSSGDGAWIMKKCARIMGGDCHIVFEEDRTVFTFKCPAVPYGHEHVVKDAASGPDFVIPKGTWGVGLDDSRIQRKLLDRFLCTLGIDLEHRRVLGEDANEILNFNRFVKELARDHPNDKILIIADENLDMEGSQTVSGSLSTQQLLEDLGGDRNRVLALVRSANDSKDDIDLYKSRTHGFIPKAPLKKDKVKEMIQPFWRERFGLDETQAAQIDPLSIAASSEVHNGVSIEAQTYDIMKTVEAIDALLDAPDEGEIAQRWPAIWEKLHLLRGDLLVIFGSARAKTVTEAINHLRGDEIPQGLKDRWALIRSLVLSLL